jgi:hypothetical protein
MLGQRQLGQESLGKTAGIGQPERTVGIVKKGQDKKERKGWPEHDIRTGRWDRTTEKCQPWQESHGSKVGT